jgi:glycerol-3-phosphate cytidylyltransferase
MEEICIMLYGANKTFYPSTAEPCYNTAEKWKPNIGITFGAFDLLHAGHTTMLQQCKNQCDQLIVGLQSDPTIDRPDTKNKPIQSLFERYAQLDACRWVDAIIPYDSENDLLNILSIADVRKRFIGEEYRGQYIHGSDICAARNIEIIFIDRQHGFSSSELRRRVANESHR